MPKVSVIIPFYSHKEWLQESLESVFAQTFQDFEVILVDDGSKEDITDIIDDYKGRIRYIRQENKGPAAARNLGMKHAKGKYIAFEDADDIWLPDKLAIQIPFMEEREIVWSHTGFCYWWPKSGKTRIINVNREYGDIHLQQYISVKMATPCVVINRNYFRDGDLIFPEQYRNGEDGQLWSKIGQLYPVGLVKKSLVKVRMRGNNSNTHAIERFKLNAEAYEHLKRGSEDCPLGVILIKRIYYFYAKIFRGRVTSIKTFFAKCLWAVPYIIERVYVKYLSRVSNKDRKYIIE